MPPVTVEIDTGLRQLPRPAPDPIWLIRLRNGERSVITTIGLSRTSAAHLAEQITDLVAQTPKRGLTRHRSIDLLGD